MFDINQRVNEIVSTYEGYIPAQFLDKPKARETMRFMIKVALASAIMDQLAECFSMEEASGKVLDMIAQNFGLTRNLPTPNYSTPFFQLPEYQDVSYVDPLDPDQGTTPDFVGYTDYSTITNYDSVFRRYSSSDSQNINTPDDILKQVIIFKVLASRCKGSLESIIDLLKSTGLDNAVSITDGMDRTIVYRVSTTNSILASIIFSLNLFPRPIGIESSLIVVSNPLGIFHFLQYGRSALGFCFNAYGYPLNGRGWLKYGDVQFNP